MSDTESQLARVAGAITEAQAAKPIVCPKCGHEFNVEIVARHREQSTIHWRIHPHAGELMDAGTVGGTLADVRSLLRSVGKEIGIPTEVLVKSITTSEDGAIDFELIIARFALVEERQKRARARRKARAA